MALNTEWLKAHWYYFAAGLVGVFVLYELVQAMSGASSSSASSSGDISGGASGAEAVSASAALQDAQVNGQVEVASYAASVADNQTAAALQANELQTAAELAATQSGQAEAVTINGQNTSASEFTTAQNDQTAIDINGQNVQGAITVNGQNTKAAEQIQKTITGGQVQQTSIEGQTIDTLGQQKEDVSLAVIGNVNSQIQQIQDHSKNAAKDYGAIAPVLAEETGQGGTVGAAKPTPGSTTAQNVSATATGISSILNGLFA